MVPCQIGADHGVLIRMPTARPLRFSRVGQNLNVLQLCMAGSNLAFLPQGTKRKSEQRPKEDKRAQGAANGTLGQRGLTVSRKTPLFIGRTAIFFLQIAFFSLFIEFLHTLNISLIFLECRQNR